MQFTQFGMLGALGALAVPVVIHLMFRQRARTVDLGTLQFLRVVLRDNARQRKVRRWLLLALRLACVALVALVFARPYLLATEPVEGERLVVVLLDTSASMGLKGGPRPIDRALAEARAVVGRAGTGTHLEVAAFNGAVHPLTRPSDLRDAPPKPSAAGTDYAAAMAWARDLCVRSGKRAKEVHVLTDLQRSGLDRGETVTLPADAEVHLADFGRAFPKNVAVTAVASEPKTVRPGGSAAVRATVFNASPLPLTKVPIKLHLVAGAGETRDAEKTIDLDGASSATVTFNLADLPEGLWRGHVEAASAGDELAFDDRRYLALDIAPPTRVLLVDGDPGRTPFESETYFLQAALRLAAEGERYAKSPFDPRPLDLVAGAELPDLRKTGAVVLANVGNLGGPDAKRLAAFVERGGGLLVFTGDRVGPDAGRALASAGLGVGEVVGPATADAATPPWRLERWETGHPIFRPFADPEHGDLRRPSFATITRLKPGPDARVLAWFRGGEPALLERSHGRGKVVWFASACDRAWGDWPRGRLYLPMVHQMIGYVAGLADGGRVRQETADGGRAPGISGADGVVRVVNTDPVESETARCTPRQFADRFGVRLSDPADPATARRGARKSPDERLRGDEVWPWLALALVGVLMLENFLANRTAA